MKMIIGLGNPGERYVGTRHNAGWLALDSLLGANDWHLEKKFNAFIKKEGGNIYLKPLSFMNLSGENTYQAMRYYHLLSRQFGVFLKKDQDLRNTLGVIHDDLDLNLGAWKISDDSRSGGNKGVQSIIKHLKTQKFQRLRLGIKTELLRNPIPAEKFVLQKFSLEELNHLNSSIDQGLESFKKSFLL
jgi:peptidyl-tRNA hydrolase, PTH1 family